jgi:hypothetical protein
MLDTACLLYDMFKIDFCMVVIIKNNIYQTPHASSLVDYTGAMRIESLQPYKQYLYYPTS